MAGIALEKADHVEIAKALRHHLKTELDVEIGGLEAEFLLEFVVERVGPRLYNRGLRDSQAVLTKRMEVITEAIDELYRAPPRD